MPEHPEKSVQPTPEQTLTTDPKSALNSGDPNTSRTFPTSDEPGERTRQPGDQSPSGQQAPLVGSVEIPGYELLGEISRGGMGVVYKARQIELDRVVALKVLLPGPFATAEQQARFKTEARAVARLDHPGIVRIYEVGESNGIPFYSMELVEGGTLREQLRGEPMPALQAAQVARDLAKAVHYSHECGVLHRDLKPANVLCHTDDTLKLTDFGLAKFLDQGQKDLTASGAILGTASYMPPEQAMGKTRDIGPATDVYSLGAILYECVTGTKVFTGDGILEILDRVRSEDPVPPTRRIPGLFRQLEFICLKCLEKNPAHRYQTAGELVEALERFLDNPADTSSLGVSFSRVLDSATKRFTKTSHLKYYLAAGFAVVALIAAWMIFWKDADQADSKTPIPPLAREELIIGGKFFLESSILAEMLATMIRHEHPGIRVKTAHFYGRVDKILAALKDERIDLYVEYSGTMLTYILEESVATSHNPNNHRAAMLNKFMAGKKASRQLHFFPRFGFNNSYALVMLRARARELGLNPDERITISQLAAVSRDEPHRLTFRSTDDFLNRPVGGVQGLVNTYHLRFARKDPIKHENKYTDLLARMMDVTAGYTTDPELYRQPPDRRVGCLATQAITVGASGSCAVPPTGCIARTLLAWRVIQRMDWSREPPFVILEDDQGYFPKYYAAPLVHKHFLLRYPSLKQSIHKLAGLISQEEMADLIDQAKQLDLNRDNLKTQQQAQQKLRQLVERFLRTKKVLS